MPREGGGSTTSFSMPEIIFSADDFGLTQSVNEAVELAHVKGRLTQASLMVAATQAQDAIARAHRLPNLKTGLHLVLVDGDSLLGHAKLPNITKQDGKFGRNQTALGFQYFFSAAARRELAAEIRAQFAAYAASGLPLHHADAHKHMHLHPTVGGLLIAIGKEFGLTRIRVPAEPPEIMQACGEKITFSDRALYAWTKPLRAQANRAGLASTDHVFGIKWSGHMTAARIKTLIQNQPSGSSEIYFHPATTRDACLKALMPDYEHEAELQALLQDYAPRA
jgi:hopanoid biosynthesis associated protein HpnK